MIILGIIGFQELLLIIALALFFSGGSKIPEIMHALGSWIRNLTIENDETSMQPDKFKFKDFSLLKDKFKLK